MRGTNSSPGSFAVPPAELLPEALRSHGEEVRTLQARLAEEQRKRGELHVSGIDSRMGVADSVHRERFVRDGGDPSAAGSPNLDDLLARRKQADERIAALTSAAKGAISDYVQAMTEVAATVLPEALAAFDTAEAAYLDALAAVEAVRADWLKARTMAAVWIGISEDPENASASINVRAVDGDLVVIARPITDAAGERVVPQRRVPGVAFGEVIAAAREELTQTRKAIEADGHVVQRHDHVVAPRVSRKGRATVQASASVTASGEAA